MSESYNNPPEWAQQAIWYQILVERFRNGNTLIHPTRESIAGSTVDKVPEQWSVTPWGHNWYKKEEWASHMPVDFYRTVQLRRFGGDLTGVKEKIPYFKKLGINAIYFNPINHAPSLHKYDTSFYHHVDAYFGPDPEGDIALMKNEDPANAETWVWTKADRYFIDLLKELYDNEIRTIVDFSWNHTGHTFWAFEDLKTKKTTSRFADWYEGVSFSEKGKLQYGSWNNVTTLPEFKKYNKKRNPEKGYLEGHLHPDVTKHIFDVCKRWINPVIDGKKSKGIDGMRLDVADLVPMTFWVELRTFTRNLNPDFLLVGENWWEEWPHKLLDPRPWLKGDSFDSVMHYQWFQIARAYFGDSADNIGLLEFIGKMQALYYDVRFSNCRTLMNLASSHDSPRLLTSMGNSNHYKYLCKPSEDPYYKTNYPDTIIFVKSKLLIIHQFTFLGAPHIWNGDEMGMVGADDPDNRKPIWWPDILFDVENASEFSAYNYSITPVFNHSMFDLFQKLIKLRKKYSVLSRGSCLFYTKEIEITDLLIYTREDKNQCIVVMINNHTSNNTIPKVFQKGKILLNFNITDNSDCLMPPYSAQIRYFDENPSVVS